MNLFKVKNWFTLIEVLIVIVIIGILATALIPRIVSVQARARDTKRKVDITTIYNGVMIYAENNNAIYPLAGGCAINTQCYVNSTSGWFWIPALTWILATLPLDPINSSSNTVTITGYGYMYGNIFKNGKEFLVLTRLENRSDPDRCAIQDYHFYGNYMGGTIFWCQVESACAWGLTACQHTCYGWIDCWQLFLKADIWP